MRAALLVQWALAPYAASPTFRTRCCCKSGRVGSKASCNTDTRSFTAAIAVLIFGVLGVDHRQERLLRVMANLFNSVAV